MDRGCNEHGAGHAATGDGEGALGDPDEKKRKQAVENHHKWVDAAKKLGCHSIRVNAASSGSRAETTCAPSTFKPCSALSELS